MVKVISNISPAIFPIAEISTQGEPIKSDSFQYILKGRNFVAIDGQILFEKDGQYFLTKIDNDQHTYTVDDYMELPEGAPYQLIDGKLEFMPSPLDKHQNVSINLSSLLFFHTKKNKLGQVRYAPLDVHFDEENVFQPDLFFISNERKHIIGKFIYGAPDLVVEILSSNKKFDLGEKMEGYGKHDVLEYWIIDYEEETLALYVNEDKKMVLQKLYQQQEIVNSPVLPDFSLPLNQLFA